MERAQKVQFLVGALLSMILLVLALSTKKEDAVTTLVLSQGSTAVASAKAASLDPEVTLGKFAEKSMTELLKSPMEEMRQRVGLDEEAVKERDRIIGSTRNIMGAKNYLRRAEVVFEPSAMHRRYKALELLVTAIAIPSNPGREVAVKAASELILEDNLDTYTRQRDLALVLADRAFLYQAMLRYYPERASDVYAQSIGTKNARLLELATQKFEEEQQMAAWNNE